MALRQSLAAYRAPGALLRDCDAEIERLLQAFESALDPDQEPLPPAPPGQNRIQGQGCACPTRTCAPNSIVGWEWI